MATFYGMKRLAGPDAWEEFVGATKWREGFSAMELARAWHDADGFPSVVKKVLAQGLPALHVSHGVIEFATQLDSGRAPSMTDLMVYAHTDNPGGPLVVVAVEGKVKESFGPRVSEWLDNSAHSKKGQRLAFLAGVLGIEDVQRTHPLHYQLLHRTASAVLEAARLGADRAVVLIHSFAAQDDVNFNAFKTFLEVLGAAAPTKNELIGPIELGKLSPRIGAQIQTYFAWVSDRPSLP